MPDPLMCPPELLARDLDGRHYIVTGGNSGIGLSTVRQLAAQRAQVTLACRRPDEGRALAAGMAHGGDRVTVRRLDLGELASVRAFAAAVLEAGHPIHGLVNNAGVMNPPEGRTKDGFETQIGVNHLGHFLLTELLLERIRESAPARIVIVSSCYHDVAVKRKGEIDLEDLHFDRRPYDGWAAYAQSKLANLLHARALADRLDGSGVVAVSLHPGWVRTQLARTSFPLWIQNVVLRPIFRWRGMIEPWEGAQTTFYCLLAPEVEAHSGAYFSQLGWYRDPSLNGGGWPMRSPNPNAHDDGLVTALEERSRALVME